MVRHHDQDERERDGAVRWDTFYPIQRTEFEEKTGRRCTHREWIDYIHCGSNKARFKYCLNVYSSDSGTTIKPELMSPCINSENLDRNSLSHRFCAQSTFYHQDWTCGRRKGKQRM